MANVARINDPVVSIREERNTSREARSSSRLRRVPAARSRGRRAQAAQRCRRR